MKRVSKLILLIVVLTCIFILNLGTTFGDSQPLTEDTGFRTNSYEINANIADNNTIEYKEKINVNFQIPRHGIFRVIPVVGPMEIKENGIVYDDYRFSDISDIKVRKNNQKEEFDVTTKSKGSMSLTKSITKFNTIKIGDADTELIGAQEYEISYKLSIYKHDYDGQNIIYLGLLPPRWRTPIDYFKATVTLPKAIDIKNLKIYYGSYGSRNNIANNAKIENLEDGKMRVTVEASNVNLGDGLSLYTPVPNNYFTHQLSRNLYSLYLLIGGIIVTLISLLLWILWGRDPHITRTVEFYPPKGTDPVFAGYVVKQKIELKDVSSLLMYMANKGYIGIELNAGNNEAVPNGERKHNNHEMENMIIRKKVNFSSLNEEKIYVQDLFTALFPSDSDNEVSYGDLDENFWEEFNRIKSDASIKSRMRLNKLYNNKSTFATVILRAMIYLFILGSQYFIGTIGINQIYTVATVVIAFFMHDVGLSFTLDGKEGMSKFSYISKTIVFNLIGLIAVAVIGIETNLSGLGILPGIGLGILIIVSFFFQRYEKAISPEGAKYMGKLLGFKDYIEVAEEDRLKKLALENPSYFYDILPYAEVFSLTDIWIEKFKTIHVESPNWYMGNSWYGYWIMSDVFRYSNNVASTGIENFFAAEEESMGDGFGSGGSFGSGGFSGGGFGGGGGGSW